MENDHHGTDEKFMQDALKEAWRAAEKGEVPVGAVIVREGRIIARGHNLRERLGDPTAHAEMLAMRDAAQVVGGWRLNGCTLYVTMEPCPMCAGAAIQARLDRIVYGAADPKAGAAGSCVDLLSRDCFNHRVAVTGGVLAGKCAFVVQEFFRKLRATGTEQDREPGKLPGRGCHAGPDLI